MKKQLVILCAVFGVVFAGNAVLIASEDFNGGTVGAPVSGWTALYGDTTNFNYVAATLPDSTPCTVGRVEGITGNTYIFSKSLGSSIPLGQDFELTFYGRMSGRYIRFGLSENTIAGYNDRDPLVGVDVANAFFSFVRPNSTGDNEEKVATGDDFTDYKWYEVKTFVDVSEQTATVSYRQNAEGAWIVALADQPLNWDAAGADETSLSSFFIRGEAPSSYIASLSLETVPEPASIGLLGLGLFSMLIFRRSRI